MNLIVGALRIALAIVLASVALAVLSGVGVFGYQAYVRSKAAPYEVVRQWSYDATDPLQPKLVGKTKLLSETIYVDLTFNGHPSYVQEKLSAVSASRQITVVFRDKDGFKVHERSIDLNSFTTVMDKGKVVAFAFEYSEHMEVDKYARLDRVALGWNFDPARVVAEAAPEPQPSGKPEAAVKPEVIADHCAPGISKAERLKRLGKHGPVRETGLNEYSAGSRSVMFIGNAEVLTCR